MNRKQLVSIWCGIVAIVFCALVKGLLTGWDYSYYGFAQFCVCVFVTALVTGGLILTFRDRKRPEGQAKKPMNLRRGFERITLILSLLSASVLLIAGILNALAGEWDDMVLCLAGSLAAFSGVWIIYGIIRWAIIPIVRWATTGFRIDTQ